MITVKYSLITSEVPKYTLEDLLGIRTKKNLSKENLFQKTLVIVFFVNVSKALDTE